MSPARLLFLVVSSSVIGLVASTSTANVTVIQNGTDSKDCLVHRTVSCQSLVYVLEHINTVIHSGENLKKTIFIKFHYDQIIASPLKVNIGSSSSPISVTVSGIGNPVLSCKSNSFIDIKLKAKSHEYNWEWKNMTFQGCGGTRQHNGSTEYHPGLFHSNASVITIRNCFLSMNSQVMFYHPERVSITNCTFSQYVPFQCAPLVHSDCSNQTHHGFDQSNFFFKNNTIANYTCNGSSSYFKAFLYSPNCYSHVEIDGNQFLDINFNISHPIEGGIIDLFNRHVKGAIYSASYVKFSNNYLANIKTDLFLIGVRYPVHDCFVENNNFTLISNQTNRGNRTVLLMERCESVHLLCNRFTNITNFLLVSTVWSSSASSVTVRDLVIANNSIGREKDFPSLLSLIASNISVHGVHATSNHPFAKRHDYDACLLNLNGTKLLTVGDLNFSNNHVPYTKYSTLVLVNSPDILISNVQFKKNIGTPLTCKALRECDGLQQSLVLAGKLSFEDNAGIYGGALSLGICGPLTFLKDTHLIARNNVAQYGGFMYVNHTTNSDCNNASFLLKENFATSAGDLLYLVTPSSNFNCSSLLGNNNKLDSVATNLSYHSDRRLLSVFPGQEIFINVSLTDYFGHPSSCDGDVALRCDDGNAVCSDEKIILEGPGGIIISQAANTHYVYLNTKHSVSSYQEINTSVAVEVTCKTIDQFHTLSLVVHLNIVKCPLGFVYNPSERVCECGNRVNNFICSTEFGAACVARGYWYGPIDDSNSIKYAVASCSFSQCSSSSYEPCPQQLLPRDGTGDFVLLRSDSNDQCSSDRGGVLCRNCRKEHELSFTAVKCVPISYCEQWQPYVIILISLVFQILFAIILLIVVRFKISLGSGFLYGPMLFLSVIANLPFSHYSEYSILDAFVSVFSSIPLLNFEVFGLIPWCFFYPFDQVYNYSLRYLGPLTVLGVILVVVFTARYCSKVFRRLQHSPLRAMCLLMILSFWSLANTSIQILTPKVISGSLWVSVQPDMRYFSLRHLPVAIPSLLVLLVLITPLLLLLLFFPLLSRVINLHRIKPFLDEFHSCYKDSFRWYSAMYFISWIIVIIFQSLPIQLEIARLSLFFC